MCRDAFVEFAAGWQLEVALARGSHPWWGAADRPVPRTKPVGLATFDRAGNFSAQLMKRDRDADAPSTTRAAVANNTGGVDGYDSYFGTFVADDSTGIVTQTLAGTISPRDVGRVVTRHMRVENDVLTITVETSTLDGEPVTRTLVWERAPGT